MTRSRKTPVNFIPCGCGCGELMSSMTKKGKPRKYKYHHIFNMPINKGRLLTKEEKEKIGASTRGDKHWNYHGGRSGHGDGYIRRLVVTSSKRDRRIFEHRFVWEEYNKACLLPWSNVHHINHKRDDNRPENLEAMMNYKHAVLHRTGWRKNKPNYCGNEISTFS